jgi:Transposase DDE domain
VKLLRDITATGAHVLCRSGARRTPLILRELPDRSYLSTLDGRFQVRVIEAWITIGWADGTTEQRQWRLITSLLDHHRHPAAELVDLYHRRWQAETTYLSIKSTILHGRVLRSTHPADIDQEMWALLTVYQTLIRTSVDALTTRPGTPPDRISFTVALHTAADLVIAAVGIIRPAGRSRIGVIGQAVLDRLLPAPRRRSKNRARKNPTSKYSRNAGTFPRASLGYTLTTQIMIMPNGLTPLKRR